MTGAGRFSKRDLVDIHGIIHSSARCRGEAGLHEVMKTLAAMVSADRGACLSGRMESGSILDISRIVEVNPSGEWARIYFSEKLNLKDPITRYIHEHKSPVVWSEAFRRYPFEPYSGFVKRLNDFGMRFGIASGASSAEPGKGFFIVFAGCSDHFGMREKKMIEIVAPHIFQALSRQCRAPERPSGTLSARETEVLKWLKEGKTNWEISVILSISERTVKYHVQNIRTKLKAMNKAHAIAVAMEAGFI